MTNVIQDAYVLQTRQAIFMRLSRIADEKFIPVLDVAIDEIDQLRKDVELLREFIKDMPIPEGVSNTEFDDVLAATETKP